jgi:O-antigen biosynthesis protein
MSTEQLVIWPKRLRRGLTIALILVGDLPATLRAATNVYRREGFRGVRARISTLRLRVATGGPFANRNDYREWVKRFDTLDDASREQIRRSIVSLPTRPKISVLMPVFNPPVKFLEQAIESVISQLYDNWELCIADDQSTDPAVRHVLKRYGDLDSRIRITYRTDNGHIAHASNTALELVTGEFVGLLDHDDLLPEHALYNVVKAINESPELGLIYSDEDKVDEQGHRKSPYFKSDWNLDLFRSHNMISHFGVYRTSLVRSVGGFRPGFEGSQDYDLALRCIERLNDHQIRHIPRVLYHWRIHSGSTARAGAEKPYAVSAGQRALADHLQRLGVAGAVTSLDNGGYRVSYALPDPAPAVTLIIPTHNRLDLLKNCIDSIQERTAYSNYDILIVDNNSDDAAALAYLDEIVAEPRINVIRDPLPFNFSRLNNSAVSLARGQFVALINNDIEVISPDWLDDMVSVANQDGVGAVGARLWYPNDRIQHAGIVIGMLTLAGHIHRFFPRGAPGYFGRASLRQGMSAVTGACMVIRKSTYEAVGGMDETNLAVAFNDVDFCLKVLEAGYRNVFTPFAELYHHESASRGLDDRPEKRQRFVAEVNFMKQRWSSILTQGDPAYNPNLSLDDEACSLAWPPRGRAIP